MLTALYGHHVDVLHVHGRILVVAGDPATTAQPCHRARCPGCAEFIVR